MTAGQVSDCTGAAALLVDLPKAQWLLGDRGYDANWFSDALEAKGIRPCIPGRKSGNCALTTQNEVCNSIGDTPALNVSERGCLNGVHCLGNELAALQQRWDDGITGKELRGIGEAYASGRFSFVCNFELAIGREISADYPELPPGGYVKVHSTTSYVAHFVNKADTPYCANRESRNEQVVFIEVIRLSDFPKRMISSLVRLYDCEELQSYQGKSLHYSSCRWRGLSRFGRLEGISQRLPAFIGGETYAGRVAGLSAHQARHDVFQGATKTMESVSHSQGQLNWEVPYSQAKRLLSGLSVAINEDVVEVGIDVGSEPLLNLLNVAVGPFDF